jgi:hypothetical protein
MTRTDWRPRRAPRTRYRSLSNFYKGDRRRIHSRELDIGLWWREATEGPLHRAAWVSDTGELYLVRLGPSEEGGGDVEVLARVTEREQLESALDGWREQCGRPRSLRWLRLRALRLADRVEDRPRGETRVANLGHSASGRPRLRPSASARARPASPASEMPNQTGRLFDARELAWRAVS